LHEFGKQITEKFEILRITIGNGGKTPNELKTVDRQIKIAERMIEGNQHKDSKSQSLIYMNEIKQNKIISFLDEQIKNITIGHEKINLKNHIFADEIYSERQVEWISTLFFQAESIILWEIGRAHV